MCTIMPVLSLFMRPPDTPTMVGSPSSLATTAEWDSKLEGGKERKKECEGEGRAGKNEVLTKPTVEKLMHPTPVA